MLRSVVLCCIILRSVVTIMAGGEMAAYPLHGMAVYCREGKAVLCCYVQIEGSVKMFTATSTDDCGFR